MVVAKDSRPLRLKIEIFLLLTLVFSTVFAGVIVGFWAYGPVPLMYEPVDEHNHRAEIIDKNLVLHRKFVIHHEGWVQIDRELVKGLTNGSFLTITLPSTRHFYLPGTYDVQRIIELPVWVPDGNYRLQTTISWQATPLKVGRVNSPELQVFVPRR